MSNEGELSSVTLGRLNARLDRLCPTKKWTVDDYAIEVIHRTGATNLNELAEALGIKMRYNCETSFATEGGGRTGVGRTVFIKDRDNLPYTAALIASILYGIENRSWIHNTQELTWKIYQTVGDALLRALNLGDGYAVNGTPGIRGRPTR